MTGGTLAQRIVALGVDPRAGERAVRRLAAHDEAIDTVLARRAGLEWTGGGTQTERRATDGGTDTATIMLITEPGVEANAVLERSAETETAQRHAPNGAGAELIWTRRRTGFGFEMMEAFERLDQRSPLDEGARIRARARRGGPHILAIAINAANRPDEKTRRATREAIEAAFKAWGERKPAVMLIATSAKAAAKSQLDTDDAKAQARRVETLCARTTDLSALLNASPGADGEEEPKHDVGAAVAGLKSLAGHPAIGEAWRSAIEARTWLVPALKRAGAERIEGTIVELDQRDGSRHAHTVAALVERTRTVERGEKSTTRTHLRRRAGGVARTRRATPA